MCLRLLPDTSLGHADKGWQWSGAVSVETIGYSPLKVRAAKSNEGEGLASTNLMIHTEVQGSVTVLTVHPQAASNTALEVCNHSSVVTVCFRQTQVPQELEEAAAPGAAAVYCWDFPHAPPVLHMRYLVAGTEVGAREYNMDRLGAFPPLKLSPHAHRSGAGRHEDAEGACVMLVSVVARGPTKVLVIQDMSSGAEAPDSETWPPSLIPATPAVAGSTTGQAAIRCEGSGEREIGGNRRSPPGRSTTYTVDLAGIGLSVIDAAPEELVYASVLGIRCKAVESISWQLLDLSLANLQVDNQTSVGAPVLLGRDTSVTRPTDSQRSAAQNANAKMKRKLDPLTAATRGECEGGGLQSSATFAKFRQPPGAAAQGLQEGGSSVPSAARVRGEQPFVCVRVSKMVASDRNAAMACYDAIDLAVADCFVDLDESVLVRLLGSFSGMLRAISPEGAVGEEWGEDGDTVTVDVGTIGTLDLRTTCDKDLSEGVYKWTYVEQLRVETMRVLVSMSSPDDSHVSVCVCVFVCMYAYIYTYMYPYICIYI